jgi:hypothetical protein
MELSERMRKPLDLEIGTPVFLYRDGSKVPAHIDLYTSNDIRLVIKGNQKVTVPGKDAHKYIEGREQPLDFSVLFDLSD